MEKIIYSEEEKEIIVNYFLKNTDGSHKKYVKFVERYIEKNGKKTEGSEHLAHPKENSIYKNTAQWQYDSHHIIWDNKTNDNIITFMLSQEKFPTSGGKLRDLNKLRPDWNHQNNDGNTVLHLLAQKGNIYIIKKLLKDFGALDPSIKNKNGDNFLFILLKPESLVLDNKMPFLWGSKELEYLNKTILILNRCPNIFDDMTLSKYTELKINIETIIDKVEKHMMSDMNKSGEGFKDALKETYGQLNSIINFHYLEKNMNTTESIHKKNKI